MAAPLQLIKGTLDVLVLKALTWGPMHGFAVAAWIGQGTAGTLEVEDGALYQAAVLAASGGELPLEPYTGKPFVIDQEAGTVSLPEDPWLDSLGYKPVKIPVVK